MFSEQPWIGPWGRSDPAGRPGSDWVICADLIARDDLFDEIGWAERWRGREDHHLARIERDREKELWPQGPVVAFSYLGRPLEPSEVAGLYHYGYRLALLPAGTVVTFRGWFGRNSNTAKFELADGRTFTLVTWRDGHEEWPSYSLNLLWHELSCAAVIVPVGHRLAVDRGAAAEFADRIARLMRDHLGSGEGLNVSRRDSRTDS